MNIEILKSEFSKNRLNFISLADELINYIHDEINLLISDRSNPLGGRSWLFQNLLKNPTRFVIVEIYANGELVFKFRNKDTKEDNGLWGSDIHFSIMVESGGELLKDVIEKIKKHCTVGYNHRIDISIEKFFLHTSDGVTRIKHCLKYSELFNENSTVEDLLNTKTETWCKIRNFGVDSWKKLMKELYDFGITDCFDYPIATNPPSYRLTKKFIAQCKEEIVGSK